MIAVYAVCIVLGVVGALAWIYLGLISTVVDGKAAVDPETRFGFTGRAVVAGLLGFGLGGMSTSFAGWNTGWALIGAIGGVVLMVIAARFLGVATDEADT